MQLDCSELCRWRQHFVTVLLDTPVSRRRTEVGRVSRTSNLRVEKAPRAGFRFKALSLGSSLTNVSYLSFSTHCLLGQRSDINPKGLYFNFESCSGPMLNLLRSVPAPFQHFPADHTHTHKPSELPLTPNSKESLTPPPLALEWCPKES